MSALRRSLVLLGVVVTIALVGLTLDGNLPKVLRVAAAAASYAVALMALTMRREQPRKGVWWRFALAGLAAGTASGLLRPDPGAFTILVDSSAAVVLASVHALGLALSERMRRSLAAANGESTA